MTMSLTESYNHNKHLSAGSTVLGVFFPSVFVTSETGGIVSRIVKNNYNNSS